MPHVPYQPRPVGQAPRERVQKGPKRDTGDKGGTPRKGLQVGPGRLSILGHEGPSEEKLLELLGLASDDDARSVDASLADIRH